MNKPDQKQSDTSRPADIADSHARRYAALLGKEEPDSPQWRFLLGQLSAAATLASILRGTMPPVVPALASSPNSSQTRTECEKPRKSNECTSTL